MNWKAVGRVAPSRANVSLDAQEFLKLTVQAMPTHNTNRKDWAAVIAMFSHDLTQS